MRTILIALASALLLAFIVIQLNVLFFADDQLTVQHHLALLVLTVVALFINGLFNAGLALRDAPKTGRGRDRNRDRRNTILNEEVQIVEDTLVSLSLRIMCVKVQN